MGTKRHKPEEIVAKLRQVDDLVTAQGRKSIAEARRGPSSVTRAVTYFSLALPSTAA